MPKILLVDDNEENRDLLSRRLGRRDYDIITAENGEQAVARTQNDAPDLVLMDMNMPVLDGWEATRRIRAAGLVVPIIALTAHALSGDREKALDAGCDDHHPKPVELPRLLSQIEALLSQQAAATT